MHPDFVKTVVDKLPGDVVELMQAIGPGLCVAGGFVRDAITGVEPKDVDLFAVSPGTQKEAIEWFEWNGRQVFSEIKTANAVTFRPAEGLDPCVQFVTRVYYSTHDQLIRSFDFSICQACVYWNGGEWVGRETPQFWEDITREELRYTAPERDEDPGASVLRLIKFTGRGYKIGEEDITKCLARFASKLYDEPEVKAHERIKTAFRRIGYAGKQKGPEEV